MGAHLPNSCTRLIGCFIAVPQVPATLAKACLDSVPIGKQEALKLVDSIKPYLEWQSDAAYKADPPADYGFVPVDIFGALAKVRQNIVDDKYKGEADFQLDLYKTVFGPGHDGHMYFYPDALARVFRYTRQRALISVSEDGVSAPVIKVLEDFKADPKSAKAVSKINGIDAPKYLETVFRRATWNQDVDSGYNGMFYQRSLEATGGKGYFKAGGRTSFIYEGPNTTITYVDGTTVSFENQAAISGNLNGVVDGASYYKKFCTPKPPAKALPAASKVVNGALPGYPAPVIIDSEGIVSGYYLQGEGVEDVAVIVLTAFESNSPAEFQATVHDFIQKAKADGKKKIVIDFQGNGGGYILLGYDFYRQFFPQIEQDGFSRWKEAKSFLDISRIFSDEAANLDTATSDDAQAIEDASSWFNYRYDLNLTNDPFKTFQDKFAPHVFKNTDYTALMRWNLTDPLTTTNATYGLGIEISGYGKLANLTQPFAAEDIVMIYDGVCASTCTLASEMLRIQGGVKSIAFGGRPDVGAIQGVGGVKGAQVLGYSSIKYYIDRANSLTNDPKQKAEFARYNDYAIQRSTACGINARDQILKDNVNDGLPAQFVAEETDCRLYWTEPMINDITEVWKAAAQSAFNNKKCNAGGIKHSGAKQARAAVEEKFVKRGSMLASVDFSQRPHLNNIEWVAQHLQKAIP